MQEQAPDDARRRAGSPTERSPIPMATTEGPTHVLRQVNAAFCQLVGKEREALLERPFGEVVPAAVQDGSQSLLDRVYLTGESGTTGRVRPRLSPDGLYWSYTAW